jgi:hypothetical protein
MNESNDPFEQDFDFPSRVLDQISECSPEGFILFVVSEHGEVEMFSKPGAEVVEAGLRMKAIKYLQNITALEDNEIAQQLFHQRYGPPPVQDSPPEEDENESK